MKPAIEWLYLSKMSSKGTEIIPVAAHKDIFITAETMEDPNVRLSSPFVAELLKDTNEDDYVGVMIAGNFGRPGGASMGDTREFVPKRKADTQEESLVTALVECGKYASPKRTVVGKLSGDDHDGFDKSWMCPPECHPNDFLVWDGTFPAIWPHTGYRDIRTAGAALYGRENGFWLQHNGDSTFGHSNAYISFVAGPNCGGDLEEEVEPRPPIGTKLDTMYRTTAPRIRSAHATRAGEGEFRECVVWALFGSLRACHTQGCKRVIVAGVSKGIYAGPYADLINSNYLEWFTLAPKYLEDDLGRNAFDHVLVPVSRTDNSILRA